MVELVKPTVGKCFLANFARKDELRENFKERTDARNISWRKKQLKAFVEGCNKLKTEFADAIRKDLGKNFANSFFEI